MSALFAKYKRWIEVSFGRVCCSSKPSWISIVIIILSLYNKAAVHADGRYVLNLKNPSYRNRTALFKEELKKGNVSLKLSRVRLEDKGNYTCLVPHFSQLKTVSQLIVGESQLIGSTDPIVAVAGDDVILPCFLEPPINAENLTVAWTRPDLNPKYVHFYRDGRKLHDGMNLFYKDRTMLLEGELIRGNVSLKLSRVELKDDGNYTCLVIKDGQKKETVIQLSVVEVSKPEVSIQEAREDGMVLKCVSGGWYPEPELEWRDSEGRLLPADVTQTDRLPDPGPHQRYTVTSNVTVQKTDTNRFTCRVHLQRLNQIRETEIHVPDHLFQLKDISSSDFKADIILGVPGVLVILLVVAAAVAAAVCWKKRTAGSKEINSPTNTLTTLNETPLMLEERVIKNEKRRGGERSVGLQTYE
ncbi:butyrophilin subfamily 1 member A1-like isoform X2 [Hypomesus transpacificus]|uniref:butyrophilin subfamily 1 member A1-like isoform X2 n=1 Tax=Hypomesus transpacificus TaxID=137520 RepID=UPI001F083C72|nr:butyrophilin subfamily 1 member A1-like isoform X2 [Hypomesus transpacificus]